ncbi:interferon-induced protein 44-like isoform X2 [Trematomus bernacchii]|uniref:interferon-induced protein 44-like isoform X2 n=1 Tax=Trematomus bernacchii TaxID=40690 RepID=UPI00146CC439|nr:interferon-induced protein 44-like isoform X2 [Trematomus bernacchii]
MATRTKSWERWGDEEVSALLSICAEDETQRLLLKPGHNSKVYERYSVKLRDLGIFHDASACRVKMKKMKQDYKKTKDHNNKRGNYQKSTKWYDRMDALLGHRPSFSGTASTTDSGTLMWEAAETKDSVACELYDDDEVGFSFGLAQAVKDPTPAAFAIAEDVISPFTLCSNVSSTEKEKNIPTYTFPATQPKLEFQWREVEWTEEQKASLMKTISSYRPSCHEGTQARVLLLGPVGSGKSSFISSVQSVFNGRVTNRAMVGTSSTSFTKKLQSFNIHGQKGEDPTGLVLCDIVGLGGGEMTGLTLHDVLSVIKGHAPEGQKFSPDQPVGSETVGYVKKPGLKDKIHCVAFVVDASKILTYPKGLGTTFRLLRKHISDLDIHQVALLTQIDQICPETAKDVTQVYKSGIIQEMMNKAGDLLGMSTSYVVPVKNYSSELDLNVNNDVLLLRAVDHILQYADLYFQDNAPQHTGPKIDLGV